MRNFLSENKGFTLTEVMIATVITTLLVAAISSAWIFTHKVWSGERKRTVMRIELLSAVESIKKDIRISSGDYMTFYPEDASSYSAVMMPLATVDSDGFFMVDTERKIVWDKTVFYFTSTDDSAPIFVRGVLDSWDGGLDEDGRYTLLESLINEELELDSSSVLVSGVLEGFYISPQSREVDFYFDSETPVRESDVIFGTVNITPGDHTLKFVSSGMNDDSEGFSFGLDDIRITPAGGAREAEYYISEYAPEEIYDTGGATATRIYDSVFSNQNYLEYAASEVDDYIEFTDYYDLWRESSFDSASFNGIEFDGEEVRAMLVLPDEDLRTDPYGNDIVWESFNEVDGASGEPGDGDLPAGAIVLRTILSKEKIDPSGTETNLVRADAIRVKLLSSSVNPFKIDRAYITRRDTSVGASDYDALGNSVPVAGEIPWDYHQHQQLFFMDLNDGDGDGDSAEKLPEAWISTGSYVWSEWTAFPLAVEDVDSNDLDYFVTIFIDDLTALSGFDPNLSDCKIWESSDPRTYVVTYNNCSVDFLVNNRVDAAGHGLSDDDLVAFYADTAPAPLTLSISPHDVTGTPVWSSLGGDATWYYVVNSAADYFQVSTSEGGAPVVFTSDGSNVMFTELDVTSDDDIYVVSEIDAWQKKGTVESRIFDTDISAPEYDQMKWSQEVATGSAVTLKARSSNNSAMTGATDWSLITGSSENPHDLTIGSGRYLQFLAEVEAEPFWEWSLGSLSYADYVGEQAVAASYTFPERINEHLVSDVTGAWIDDVEINWPGDSRVCVITADIAKKDDYGKVFLEFDDKALSWGYSVTISVLVQNEGRTFVEENSFTIEPRNTGR